MKKIFYILASAIVALGAVACDNQDLDNINSVSEGLTITASLDDATKVNLDGEFNASWGENDEVVVFYYDETLGKEYAFTFEQESAGVFKCNHKDVNVLVGNPCYAFCGELDSTKGLEGVEFGANGVILAEGTNLHFTPQNALLHVVADANTVLHSTDAIFVADGQTVEEVALAEGENYVACRNVQATISYSINGEEGKSLTKEFKAGVVYNLGNIAKPKEKVYLVPNGEWKTDNAWFAAYFWNGVSNVNKAVAMTDADKDGIYECELPADMTNVIFCRMNPNYTAFEWNNDAVTDRVWNQTDDLTLSAAPNNYFYITSWGEGEWNVAGYVPPVVTPSEWALAGDFNSWGDKEMIVLAEDANVSVAKNVTLAAYSKIKVKKVGTWDTSFGGGINYLESNKWMTVYDNGSDIQVVSAGTYDVYFDKTNKKLYLVVAGGDYKAAKEQSKDGAAPDTSAYKWGLCGAHNNWGNSSKDIELVWDGNLKLYVAKSAKLTGEFKVRADNSWTTNYGGGTVTVDKSSATSITKNSSGNCKPSKNGTYDVYFQFVNLNSSAKIWIKTPGSAAPTI